eukprot:5981564-Prymnesium_polylepis.2
MPTDCDSCGPCSLHSARMTSAPSCTASLVAAGSVVSRPDRTGSAAPTTNISAARSSSSDAGSCSGGVVDGSPTRARPAPLGEETSSTTSSPAFVGDEPSEHRAESWLPNSTSSADGREECTQKVDSCSKVASMGG